MESKGISALRSAYVNAFLPSAYVALPRMLPALTTAQSATHASRTAVTNNVPMVVCFNRMPLEFKGGAVAGSIMSCASSSAFSTVRCLSTSAWHASSTA